LKQNPTPIGAKPGGLKQNRPRFGLNQWFEAKPDPDSGQTNGLKQNPTPIGVKPGGLKQNPTPIGVKPDGLTPSTAPAEGITHRHKE